MGIGIVDTKQGKLRGKELTGEFQGITEFCAVPYAAPPVGNLRFMPPVDHAPWQGVRDAMHYPCRAMQPSGTSEGFEPWGPDFYFDGYPPMSEDCLYLSVTTGAETNEERRPVFVWFHGGGLSSGYYFEHEFDASVLAKKGIIVVSVGQRLNVFGYLCLPQLTKEQGHSGNYGLMDQAKALDWVRENIAAFGGDPENITVGGQSGGTWKATALTVSPLAKGKIRRCINQSNLSWGGRGYASMAEAEKDGLAYLTRAGLDPEMTVEELRALPAERFYELEPMPMGTPGGLPSSMVCDGYSIMYEDSCENMVTYGMDVDYLSGGNVGEMSIKGMGLGPGVTFETADEVYATLAERLGDLYDDEVIRREWPITEDDDPTIRSRELAAQGFSCGAILGGGCIVNRYFGVYRKAMGSQAKNYAYTFGHYTPCRPEEIGTYRDKDNLLAWHSSEMWYTFASLREGMPPCRPWEKLDFELADQLSSYWANFMKTGDPNGEGLPYWPESGENYGWIFLGDEAAGHEGLTALDEIMLKEILRTGRFPVV